jgi:glutathione S-transferase
MAKRFVLHGIRLSGPTYKVGLMLSLCGEPFAYRHVALREGAHKTPEFLKLNRYGQVPVLEDTSNGRTLCQAAAILEWLADATGKFGGASRDERLAIREWMYWDYDRCAVPVYRTRAIKLGYRQAAADVAALYEADAKVALGVLDAHLAGRDWVVGSAPSIADVDLYGVARYAPEGGLDLSGLPHLTAWMKRVEALPGFGQPEDLLPMENRD